MEQPVSNRPGARQQLALASLGLIPSFRTRGLAVTSASPCWKERTDFHPDSERRQSIPKLRSSVPGRSSRLSLSAPWRWRRHHRTRMQWMKLTDAIFMAFWRVESGTWDKQFDPSLGWREWLVSNDLETHCCGVKLQRSLGCEPECRRT